jgi:uncharacterized protein (DUF433 family)
MPVKAKKQTTPERLVYVLPGKAELPAHLRDRAVPPVTINPKRRSGAPTLAGTRLPVAALLDFLSTGGTIKQFVKEYDEVSEADCEAALLYLRDAIEEQGIGEKVDF